jgi:choline dehydrogenase-like flavoprotein
MNAKETLCNKLFSQIHLDRRKHAYGVTFIRHGMQKFVRAHKEIVVSAGAVDSPKLLMLSGIGIKSHLHQVGVSNLIRHSIFSI